MRTSAFLFSGCLFLSLMIAACAGSSVMNAAQAGMETIRSGLSGHGWGPEPGADWIADGDAYESILARLDRAALPESAGSGAIDFSRHGVLLVRMGERPTGGFGLALMPEQSHVRDRTASVAVRWIEPDKQAMVTQMITHPYLMVKINKGDFRRIAVIDQQGHTRMELTIEEN